MQNLAANKFHISKKNLKRSYKAKMQSKKKMPKARQSDADAKERWRYGKK